MKLLVASATSLSLIENSEQKRRDCYFAFFPRCMSIRATRFSPEILIRKVLRVEGKVLTLTDRISKLITGHRHTSPLRH